MYSQYTSASRTAGIAQQCSGIRFTSMGTAVSTLGALFGGFNTRLGNRDPELPPYRRLADGDGH